MRTMRQTDPTWWRLGTYEGRSLRVILRQREIACLFRFLRTRGWSRAAIAAATGLAETRVREIYHGRQQVTSYEVLERIAYGLNIDRGLLGLAYSRDDHNEPHSEQPVPAVDPSSYKDFIGALAAMAVGSSPHDISHLLPPPPPPAQDMPALVTAAHVRVLREVSDRHRQFDADQGGGSCRDSAAAYLRWALSLRRSRFDSRDTERELIAALSDMYQVVGWACHDLGDHAASRRNLVAGLALAREINDLVLVSGAFYRLGRVSIHQGHPDEALKLWQLGQIVAQDSGCLVSVAVLHANEAWAYAMLGAADRVDDALARAKGELGRVDAATVPSWARFFLAPADIDGISAVSYGHLASHADHRSRYALSVVEHAHHAYDRRQSGEHRSQTFDAISLSTGYALDDQPDRAGKYAHLAIDMTTKAASIRAIDRLRGLAGLLERYRDNDAITTALERIAALPGG